MLTVSESSELLDFLMRLPGNHKRTTLKQWLKFRRVSVNGRTTTRHDHPLAPGDEVRINMDKHFREKVVSESGLRVVYEDEYLIVISKPAGMLSLPDEVHHGDTALDEINQYLGAQASPPARRAKESGPRRSPLGNQDMESDAQRPEPRRPRAHVVHRLDKHTSGLLIFAKTPAIRAHFLDNWRQVEKRYLAVVRGVPEPKSGVIRSHLAEDEAMRVHSVPESQDSRPASTRYRVVRWNPARSHALIECVLETGRKNQIRVHMADIGHPVVGDIKYGVQKSTSARLALHAWRMSFDHPVTGRRMEIESEFPESLARLVDSQE
ncbi:MAG: RluA family pseudouridine synthase [Candidatus Sumerlaeota bacterium]|nr:RluA family pseudouridine synthase [Candidatus Sumerlaeota bacterium]